MLMLNGSTTMDQNPKVSKFSIHVISRLSKDGFATQGLYLGIK
jgi:hypothetical protein